MIHSEPNSKDIIAAIKESKRLEKKGKLLESLAVLDKIAVLHDNKNISISLPITKQIASLCNQIVLIVPAKVPYLRRAEQTLISWVAMSSNTKIPLNEKIFSKAIY